MKTTLKTTTLPNGLRIATVSDARARTATAMVLVGVGSSFETKEESGLSHFLEHVCFKGTQRRPSAKVLAEEIESLGAVTNAFTDREYTGYYIKGNPAHIATYTDILADIYQHSTFPEAELEKEKGVVIEEINMYEDMPQHKVGELLFEELYPDQPAGRSIAGTKATVRALTRATLVDYKQRFYTPQNTVIVFSGNVTHTKAVALAKKHFGMLRRAPLLKKQKVNDAQKAIQSRVLTKPLDQAHLMLGFRSAPLGDKDLTIIRMLATILGRGMSSRLSLLLRETLGVAYYAYAQQESYLDHGVFIIGAGIDRTRLTEVTKHLVAECRRLKTEPVSKKELAKAKEYSIGTLQLGLELSDDIATYYGVQLVLQQSAKTPEQLLAMIKKVTAADLMRVAKKLFVPTKTTMTLVGPFKQADVPVPALQAL
jgi:predicted Zn-dependent peptidase